MNFRTLLPKGLRKGIIPSTLAALALFIAPAFANSASTVQTPAQLQQLFDQGSYAQLLANLNTTLAAKTTDSDKPVRYTLLMLKGETLLRTKAYDSAADAFKAAALIGADDHEIAIARANAALVKHSSAGKYQPKTKVAGATGASALPAAIDIVDTASRKQAFAALFTDLLEPAKPQVDRAEKMTTLPPIMDLATSLADLRPVEIASSGSDTESKELFKKLGTHATTLMTTALKNLDTQINAISKEAAKRQKQERLKASSNNLSEALLSDDVDKLNDIVSQAEQIGTAAVSMQVTFGDAETFKTVESAAQQTINNVNKLLKQYKHPAAN